MADVNYQTKYGQLLLKQRRIGYTEALTDLLNALNEGGEEAARQWITNNS